MKLKKFTIDIMEKIPEFKKKTIYCYENSSKHLTQMLENCDFSEMTLKIVDDFKRNQGVYNWGNCQIPVLGTDFLHKADLRNSIIIITSDYYKEAYDNLMIIENVVSQIEDIYYFCDIETEIEEEYRQNYEKKELQNIILFRSGPHASSYVYGMDFSDNARALFEYMLKHGYNEKYELIWFVKNPKDFSQYSKYRNVKFLSFEWSISKDIVERDAYYRALCLAKYIFFTDAYGFARNCREDQIRVQLWHGCGFKTRVNFVRCEKRYEYTTVISDLYAKIHADIYGLRADQVLITGYAKQDWLFHPVDVKRLLQLGMPHRKKYVFWLPTFRTAKDVLAQLNEVQIESETGLPILYTRDMLSEVDKILAENDMMLIIKLHPFQNRDMVHCDGCQNVVLLENEQLICADIQINELLANADALISDYSSAAVDYLLLNRPIAFTLDDVEEYASGRGFVFDNIKEWLPGEEIYEVDDFVEFLKNVAEENDTKFEKRSRIREKMYRYFDEGNAKRIVESLNIV